MKTNKKMFKFAFNVEVDDDNNPFNNSSNKNDFGKPPLIENNSRREEISKEWYKAEIVPINLELLKNFDVYKLNARNLNIDDISIQHVVTGYLLDHITSQSEDNKDIRKAEQTHSDLIPAVYEGGAKVWECTEDVLQYLAKKYKPQEWRGKRVLDLGCGVGLLGIYAYRCGAAVHFQDYNRDVLTQITISNVLLNCASIKGPQKGDEQPNAAEYKDIKATDIKSLEETIQFYAGDWKSYTSLTGSENDRFDYILSSETIYNPKNQQKLLDTIYAKLSANGVALIAAKTYYFGVGGGLREFEQLIAADKRFHCEIVWKSKEGVGREILELSLRCV